METSKYREKLGLKKDPDRKELSWNTHAIDAIAIGCAETGCNKPYPPIFGFGNGWNMPGVNYTALNLIEAAFVEDMVARGVFHHLSKVT